MGDIAIRLDGISKKYRIGGRRQAYKTLRDSLAGAVRARVRRSAPQPTPQTIWALRDVSVEIQRGTIVGIVGHNGAGKSTLLKILSRITEPTSGFAEIHGSVGSLLEVGTGFHGELTGRENVFLNGAILGMPKTDIVRKFDAIVAFAEVERFIDTPVKRYSTGMYVRLAFAVAAHLEPDILIVDEVLSVGDAAFQRKCLGKMSDVSAEGRTVLFVSHVMPAIQALCSRCLLMEGGQIRADGLPGAVIDRYLRLGRDDVGESVVVDLWDNPHRASNMERTLRRMWATDHLGNVTSEFQMGGEVTFHVEYESPDTVRQPIVGLRVETGTGEVICSTNNRFGRGAKIVSGSPRGTFSCRIPRLPLLAGDYLVTVSFAKWIDKDSDVIRRAFRLTVLPADVFGTGRLPESGHCLLDGHWSYSEASNAEATSDPTADQRFG